MSTVSRRHFSSLLTLPAILPIAGMMSLPRPRYYAVLINYLENHGYASEADIPQELNLVVHRVPEGKGTRLFFQQLRVWRRVSEDTALAHRDWVLSKNDPMLTANVLPTQRWGALNSKAGSEDHYDSRLYDGPISEAPFKRLAEQFSAQMRA